MPVDGGERHATQALTDKSHLSIKSITSSLNYIPLKNPGFLPNHTPFYIYICNLYVVTKIGQNRCFYTEKGRFIPAETSCWLGTASSNCFNQEKICTKQKSSFPKQNIWLQLKLCNFFLDLKLWKKAFIFNSLIFSLIPI